MDKELIEKKLQEIHEETRKLIDEAYVCGYKDGYMECTFHKGLVKTGAYESQRPMATVSLSADRE